MVAEITRRNQPLAELPLCADVPLMQRRRLEIERRVHVDARRGESRRLPVVVERGEWVTARISEVRIGPTTRRIRDRDLRAPWRIVRKPRVEEQMRRVVEDPPRGANARALIVSGSPDCSNTRSKLGEFPFRRSLARISVVAREDEAGRRLRIHVAPETLIETRFVEVAHPAKRIANGNEGFPSNTEIE